MFFVIGPLFLLASRSRELLPDWTIGDATPGSTCMFPGTLPRRLDSQRVSPHPLYNGLIRDTSPGAAKSPDFARTFVWIYNPRNAGIIIIPHRRRRLRVSRTLIISKIPSNQQVLRESARFLRIGKITPNQPDSRTRRIRATASLPSSHCPLQPATASGSQPCSSIHRRRTLQTSLGLWAVDPAGPRALV